MSLYDDSGTGTRVFVWDQLVFLQPQILLLIVKFPPPHFLLQLSLVCLANLLPPTKVAQLFVWAAHIVSDGNLLQDLRIDYCGTMEA